ncbi:MAG: peptide chain release factor N(5)-glutamine methyltransferase [Terracidiphilus sp.]
MPPVSLFLFQGAGRLLFGPHPDRARADAESLLMHLLRIDRTWLLTHPDFEAGSELWKSYFEFLQRRCLGEPIQYITGETEFYGLPLFVTPDVLIPRPETEHLVEKAIELAMTLNRSVTGHDLSRAEGSTKQNRALAPAESGSDFPFILDVGTGSGAIAVALAHQLPHARITALDVSPAALAIASENAARNAVSGRIRFLESDLLAAVANERFEMVVSNPPYVPTRDRDSLSVEVRDHEPALALFAGDDGLDVIRRLIPEAFAVLQPSGFLLMEIGYGQSDAVAELLRNAGFARIEFVPDLQGIPRVASGQKL